MIVGDGAEKESVLRPDCLPSGEKLFQHPLKWPALEKILCAVLYDKGEHKFFGGDKNDWAPASPSRLIFFEFIFSAFRSYFRVAHEYGGDSRAAEIALRKACAAETHANTLLIV